MEHIRNSKSEGIFKAIGMSSKEKLQSLLNAIRGALGNAKSHVEHSIQFASKHIKNSAGKANSLRKRSVSHVKKNLSTAKQNISDMLGDIKTLFGEVVDASPSENLNRAKEKIQEKLEDLKEFVSEASESALEEIKDTFSDERFQNIKNSVTSKVNDLKKAIKTFAGYVMKQARSLTGNKSFKDRIENFGSEVHSGFSGIMKKIKGFGTSAKKRFSNSEELPD
ncbi:MAG: hypothetical protein KAH32_05310 [Chlamydiia bacterium]|nr:hypothetical protein [Chlamydiia bacterium]